MEDTAQGSQMQASRIASMNKNAHTTKMTSAYSSLSLPLTRLSGAAEPDLQHHQGKRTRLSTKTEAKLPAPLQALQLRYRQMPAVAMADDQVLAIKPTLPQAVTAAIDDISSTIVSTAKATEAVAMTETNAGKGTSGHQKRTTATPQKAAKAPAPMASLTKRTEATARSVTRSMAKTASPTMQKKAGPGSGSRSGLTQAKEAPACAASEAGPEHQTLSTMPIGDAMPLDRKTTKEHTSLGEDNTPDVERQEKTISTTATNALPDKQDVSRNKMATDGKKSLEGGAEEHLLETNTKPHTTPNETKEDSDSQTLAPPGNTACQISKKGRISYKMANANKGLGVRSPGKELKTSHVKHSAT